MTAPYSQEWWKDPMVWLGFLHGTAIWAFMAVSLSITSAWISLACGIFIGLFLYLVALGYQDYRFARAIVVGFVMNVFLSSLSAILAFID
jgi:hypothetical protein|tara:strand:- start:58 stop:327 length:270 start_codon:yes stop_codon:yes gene_type:complete